MAQLSGLTRMAHFKSAREQIRRDQVTLDQGCPEPGSKVPGYPGSRFPRPGSRDNSLNTVCSRPGLGPERVQNRVQDGSQMGPRRVPEGSKDGSQMGPRWPDQGQDRARTEPEQARTEPRPSSRVPGTLRNPGPGSPGPIQPLPRITLDGIP